MQWNNTSSTGKSSRIIHVSMGTRRYETSSVQLDSSWVKYKVKHEKRNSIFTSSHLLFCLLLKNKNNDIFDDFPKISDNFPEDFQNHVRFRTFPKISVHYQSCRRLPRKIRRCFDHTPTNWSTPYSDKWIKMVNFELGIEMWKVNGSTGHEPGTKKKIDSFRGLRFFLCTTLVSDQISFHKWKDS